MSYPCERIDVELSEIACRNNSMRISILNRISDHQYEYLSFQWLLQMKKAGKLPAFCLYFHQ